MNNCLSNGDATKFWKSWHKFQGKIENVSTNDGISGPGSIVYHFLTFFQKTYDSAALVLGDKLKSEFWIAYDLYNDTHGMSYWLRFPKWSLATLLKTEHILYGPPELMVHLHILFNGLIQPGYVCLKFLRGTIVPIVKDFSNVYTASYYRGIMLGVTFSQLF